MRAGASAATILDVWEGVGAFHRGLITRDELDELERVSCPGPGTCAGNFTANTMGIACEFLGIAPLGAGMVPADDLEERRRAAAEHGALATRLTTTARAFLDRRALGNAMAGIAATGGSTNGLLHLLAIAREAEVELELDELIEISARTPVIGSLTPSGRYVATDLHDIGGVPVVIAELIRAGLIDGDAPTVGRRHARRGQRERAGSRRRGRAHGRRAVQAARRARGAARQPRPRGRGGQGVGHRDAPPRGAGARLRVRGGVQRGDRERRDRARRRAGDPQRGPGRRAGHARDAERDLGGGRRRARRVGDAGHRRALLRRHARADGRPREPRGGPRRPDRRAARGRPRDRRRRQRRAAAWTSPTTSWRDGSRRTSRRRPPFTRGVLGRYCALVGSASQGATLR